MSNSKQPTAKTAPETQTPEAEPQTPARQENPENQPLPTRIAVRAYPNASDGNVLAGLTIDINGCCAIRGAKLVNGKNGMFVSMPQRQTRDGYQELVFPTTKEMREIINNTAVSAYRLALSELSKKMEQAQTAAAAPAPAPASPEMSM